MVNKSRTSPVKYWSLTIRQAFRLELQEGSEANLVELKILTGDAKQINRTFTVKPETLALLNFDES